MNIGIIVPDRGDRDKLMGNCTRMIKAQTLKTITLKVVNYLPRSEKRDITQRYREGYEFFTQLKSMGQPVHVIALMENDDWYHPEYLETMVRWWISYGKPNLFGINYSIYYHLGLKKYFRMDHFTRSSACTTFIKPYLKINWPQDDEPFTDLHLWTKSQLNGVTFKPEKHISLGIKHGTGLTGGTSHIDRLERYTGVRGVDDRDMRFLKENMDEESFKFYSTYEISDSNGNLAKARNL